MPNIDLSAGVTGDMSLNGCLAVILANPPLSSGGRTIQRVELATNLLGFSTYRIANIFSVASHSTKEMSMLGKLEQPWLESRTILAETISESDAVLLAYGVTKPSGEAKHHYDSQIEWLRGELENYQHSIWQLGDRPHHPSRWQRWTYRQGTDASFRETLGKGFQKTL